MKAIVTYLFKALWTFCNPTISIIAILPELQVQLTVKV